MRCAPSLARRRLPARSALAVPREADVAPLTERACVSVEELAQPLQRRRLGLRRETRVYYGLMRSGGLGHADGNTAGFAGVPV